MRKYILAVLFTAILFATQAVCVAAQDQGEQIPEVPQTEVKTKAQPFLGEFNAVACDSRVKRPYGLKFNIRIDSIPDPDAGKDAVKLAPVFRMLAIEPVDNPPAQIKPFDFQTLGFIDDGHEVILVITNPNLYIQVEPSIPAEHAMSTTLEGLVMIYLDGTRFALYAIRAGDDPNPKVDPWLYVKPLSLLCPVVEKDDQNEARLQRASFAVGDNDATPEEIDAADKELDDFARAHDTKIDWAVFGREEVGGPWFARFYYFGPAHSTEVIGWNNEGYPKPLMAVKALEHNFLTNPKGKDEMFQDEPKVKNALFTPETSAEFEAAMNELNSFAADHALIGAYRNGSKEGTYDVALFLTDDNGNAAGDGPKWVVYDATTMTDGVKQIESDYKTYPDGHDIGEGNKV